MLSASPSPINLSRGRRGKDITEMIAVTIWIILGLAIFGHCNESCSTSNRRDGVCMDLATCLQQEGTPLSVRHIQVCNNGPQVCCRRNVRTIARQKCERWRQLSGTSSCFEIETKVHGGVFAVSNEFPHMVAIVEDSITRQAFCGGALISENFVITAAHCIADLRKRTSRLYVRLGATNLKTDTSQVIETGTPIPHPHFKQREPYHDLALLPLRQSVKFSRSVIPACLPYTTNRLGVGVPMTVTGWGATSNSRVSENLLLGEVTTMNRLVCENLLVDFNTNGRYSGGITDGIICVDESQAGACTGDSGGPLSVKVRGRDQCEHIVYGIVANGASDCQATLIPGLYTNLQHYIEWIVNTVWPDENGLLGLQ